MRLLQMSFSGAVLVLVIMVIRGLTVYRLSKRTFLVLWELAVARLLIPFSVPSAFSLYSFVGGRLPSALTGAVTAQQIGMAVQQTGAGGVAAQQTGAEGALSQQAGVIGALLRGIGTAGPPVQQTGADGILVQRLAGASGWLVVWGAGAALCMAFFAFTYFRFRFEFGTSLPVENAFVRRWLREHPGRRRVVIRQSGRFSAPLTYGIFHPVILMPAATDWEETEAVDYALLHEYMHIRHFDAMKKLLLVLTLCVHWFNPFVWILYFLFNRDLELACDESVILKVGGAARADYARMLIRMEEKRSGLAPFYSSFSRNAIGERITAIMKMKKNTVHGAAVSLALIFGVAAVFTTSAKTDDQMVPDGKNSLSHMDGSGFTGEGTAGRQPEEILQKFAPFGITWEENSSGKYNVYWDGQLVNVFADIRPNGEEFFYPSAEKGSRYVCGIYDESGQPCGVAEIQEDDIRMEKLLEIQVKQDILRQWEEALAPYTPFGLTWEFSLYSDVNAYSLTMKYQGQEVRGIVDEVQGLWITEHAGNTSYSENAIELYAVYQDGKLLGLCPATDTQQAEWDAVRSHRVLTDEEMTEEALLRLQERYPGVAEWVRKCYPDTVWWTAEGYERMMCAEREELESMLGEHIGDTPSAGEIVVTSEMIERQMGEYEETLSKLQEGWMVSKSVGGDENLGGSFDPADIEAGTGSRQLQCAILLNDGTEKVFGPYQSTEELLSEIEPFCREQVGKGAMRQKEMDEIIGRYSVSNQE